MSLLHKNPLPSARTLDSWIAQMANGDSAGLDNLYRAAAPSVFAYALSILKNSHDAEDVLQDTFVSVFDNAASYRSQGKPMAWIFTIARNLSLKRLEQLRRVGTTLEDWQSISLSQTKMTTDDEFVIRTCLNYLAEDQRQIVILHAVSGFKHREIAQMLGIPLSTVLSKYSRALKILKANL